MRSIWRVRNKWWQLRVRTHDALSKGDSSTSFTTVAFGSYLTVTASRALGKAAKANSVSPMLDTGEWSNTVVVSRFRWASAESKVADAESPVCAVGVASCRRGPRRAPPAVMQPNNSVMGDGAAAAALSTLARAKCVNWCLPASVWLALDAYKCT